MKHKYLLLTGAILVLLALALTGCTSPGPADTQTAAQVTQAPCPTAAACPDCPTCPEAPTPVVQNVPFQDEWAASPHNDGEAEAFHHWDEEDPKEVPVDCAKCHSTPGYQDFVGADGSAFGVVDQPAAIGTTVQCVACHNPATATMNTVTFPSGAEITGLDASARCMVCHQGREGKTTIDAYIEEKGASADPDLVVGEMGFRNIHYYAAAATLYGGMAMGGYQYDGLAYDSKNNHVENFDSCIGCHNSHTTQLKIDACANCHQGVASPEDLRNIRMAGSMRDYDGDGDTQEGIASEVAGLQEILMSSIQAYAKEKAGTAIAYNANAYPYFVIDTNEDGQAGDDESNGGNGYKSWTARLLRAAYNYQTSVKDPGAYAHGGKYIIQLLHDSIADLNGSISTPVDMETLAREDAGHFDGAAEAFRHWDQEDTKMVPADCAKCHSSEGLPMFLETASAARDKVTGINISVTPTNGLMCSTCHSSVSDFTRYEVAEVKFPSGAILSFADDMDSNLCMECHQGRESKVSVDRAIAGAGVGDNEVSEALTFRNPHYFATAATLFGTNAKGAYEFDGQTYNGEFMHIKAANSCKECHDVHALTVQTQKCTACHGEGDPRTFRHPSGDTNDYDGDGNVDEGLADEITTMHETLYAAILAYPAANEAAGVAPIVYSDSAYPYWFNDANGNGSVDSGEKGYATWTPALLRAAYNYQWVAKDPGAFAHNGKYIIQILYDSINSIGGDVTAMTRPEVAAPEATPAP